MKLPITMLIAAAAGGALVWFFAPPRTSESKGPADTGRRPPGPAASATRSGGPEPVPESPAPAAAPSPGDKLLAELKDQIVVKLGSVEDIGRQTATVMLAKRELHDLKRIPIADRSPEQRRRIQELERERAAVLGVLPEVTGFQNNPEEYAGFFSSMLKEAAGLDAAQAKSISDYMRARGEGMIAAGLNSAKEPADPQQQEVWEEQRDAFNSQTVSGIAGILPPGEADRIGFNDKFIELLEQDFDRAE